MSSLVRSQCPGISQFGIHQQPVSRVDHQPTHCNTQAPWLREGTPHQPQRQQSTSPIFPLAPQVSPPPFSTPHFSPIHMRGDVLEGEKPILMETCEIPPISRNSQPAANTLKMTTPTNHIEPTPPICSFVACGVFFEGCRLSLPSTSSKGDSDRQHQ